MNTTKTVLRPALWMTVALVARFLGKTIAAADLFPDSAPGEVRDVAFFLRRLRTLDHLPELEKSHTAMASTWDRKGGNEDGNDFKRIEPDGRNILLDVDGPGCLQRIMGCNPDHILRKGFTDAQKDTRIQIFLDGNSQAVVDQELNDFFFKKAGATFPYPLQFWKTYPGCLHPIPFQQHCRVQLYNPRYGQAGWDKDWGWAGWWQLAYTIFPDGVKVKSLALPLDDKAKQEQDATCKAWLRAESTPPEPPAQWTVDKEISIQPGAAEETRLDGVGVIRQMRMRVEPSDPRTLRAVRLQMLWDSALSPSVDVPVGYFFGHAETGHGTLRKSKYVMPRGQEETPLGPEFDYSCNFDSLLLGVTSNEAYTLIPMPFAQGAVIRLGNTSREVTARVKVKLEVESRPTLPANWGRFHATYTEEPAATEAVPKLGPKNVPCKTVLERRARGKYVGVLLHLDWPHSEAWWGEGDWIIWTDEHGWPPSYHGTGSEEYFQGGNGQFDRKAVSGFVSERPGHPTLYSFHLNDAFQFQEYIRVVEEQMGYGAGDDFIRQAHPLWGSTAYWYADRALPAESDRTLLPRAK